MEWQPIETAPEETCVLVWRDDLPPLTAYQEREEWFAIGRAKISKPTHWMPLPEPPK